MKFKSGDLVIVVWSNRFPQTIGRVLTLTTPCDVWDDSWDTDPPVFTDHSTLPMSFWEPTLRLVRDGGIVVDVEGMQPFPEKAAA